MAHNLSELGICVVGRCFGTKRQRPGSLAYSILRGSIFKGEDRRDRVKIK